MQDERRVRRRSTTELALPAAAEETSARSGVYEAVGAMRRTHLTPAQPVVWSLAPAFRGHHALATEGVELEVRSIRSLSADRNAILRARGSIAVLVEAKGLDEIELLTSELRAISRWMPMLLFSPYASSAFRGELRDRGVDHHPGPLDSGAGRTLLASYLHARYLDMRRIEEAIETFAARWDLASRETEFVRCLAHGIRAETVRRSHAPGFAADGGRDSSADKQADIDIAMRIKSTTRKTYVEAVRTKSGIYDLLILARVAAGLALR